MHKERHVSFAPSSSRLVALAMLSLLASSLLAELCHADCKIPHLVGSCGSSGLGMNLECEGCTTPTCAECGGPSWVITAAQIYECEDTTGDGFVHCVNNAAIVWAQKANYQCNPTTHCYEYVNTVATGNGCQSAAWAEACYSS